MATSITQYGITITFGSDLTVGQYVNGDYYVVAPSGVSISGGTVASGGRAIGSVANRDGMMINPVPGGVQGYDNLAAGYSDTVNKVAGGFPFTVAAGQSLVASESAIPPRSRNGIHEIPMETAIVLTVVASAPAANSFRPHYCQGTKTTYNWSSVSWTDPALATVTGAPTVAAAAASVQRVQLDHFAGWTGRTVHPYQNMEDYGAHLSGSWGDALQVAMLNPATVGDKTTLLQNLIQLGIDLYGILISGGSWFADGGHCHGRKAPIIFAGHLLGVPAMRDLGYDIRFQEDGVTFYVTQTDVDTVHEPMRLGYVNGPTADYLVGDIGMADWGIIHSANRVRDDKSTSSTYRGLGAPYWMGHSLVMAILDLQDAWGHPAHFDYVNRHFTSIGNGTSLVTQNMMNAYWAANYQAPPGPVPSLGVRAIPRGAA